MMIRRSLVGVLALAMVVALGLGASASGEEVLWTLWNGDVRKGDVPVMRQGDLTLVAADQVLSLLGLSWNPRPDGLVVTLGGRKVEFWSGSPVARVNGAVFPLQHPVLGQGGHWWVEHRGALSVINAFLRSAGTKGDLAFRGVSRPTHEGDGGTRSEARKEDPKPAVSPEEVRTPASPVVKAARWGINSGFVRCVLELGSRDGVAVSKTDVGVEVRVPGGLPMGFIPKPPRPEVATLSVTAGGEGCVISFRASYLPVKVSWLEGPLRLVLDFPDRPSSTASADGGGVVEASSGASRKGSAGANGQAKEGPRERKAEAGGPPSFMTVERVFKGSARPVVAVDPGHGGKDPGAIGNGLREKDINLKVALLLRDVLSAYGVDVRLTREDDRYLKLSERTRLANQWNADLFVSLHCNALPAGRTSRGVELYLMSLPTDKDAMRLALFENRELEDSGDGDGGGAADRRTRLLMQILGDMQQNQKVDESTSFAEALFRSGKAGGLSMKRVAQAPFYVLKGAAMPAVLVEMGFITDPRDAALLRDPAFQGRMASLLARGIVEYLRQVNKR